MYKEVRQFLNEVRVELLKVTWPLYEEWLGSTIVVLVMVVAFSIYLGLIDSVFSNLAKMVFKGYGIE
jgi:preprotein translocase subunit SecE